MKNNHTVADNDAVAGFFESRGWNFILSEEGPNLYVDNNGHRNYEDKVREAICFKKF